MRFKKKQEFAALKDIMLFAAKFFVSPTGSRPSNFYEMVNGHFKEFISYLRSTLDNNYSIH